jgi:hypothetical protein
LEVFQLFGFLLAVLVLNDGIDIFVVLGSFDLLFKFSIKLRQLDLLEVGFVVLLRAQQVVKQ